MSDIVRRVKVDRSRTPQEALDATGCRQYVNDEVVSAMPRGEGYEVELVFFKPELWEYSRPGFMSDDNLEKALVRRGLTNDPFAVLKANEDDPTLTDTHPHGVHWRGAEGSWCYAAFSRWHDERYVYVYRNDRDWDGPWWFAGSRKIGS